MYSYNSIKEAYHKALDIEEYLSSFNSHSAPSYSTIPCFNQPKHGTMLVGFQFSSIVIPTRSSITKATLNKEHDSAISNSHLPSSQIEYHYCHAKGHITFQYPQHALSLGVVKDASPTIDTFSLFNQWMFLTVKILVWMVILRFPSFLTCQSQNLKLRGD